MEGEAEEGVSLGTSPGSDSLIGWILVHLGDDMRGKSQFLFKAKKQAVW